MTRYAQSKFSVGSNSSEAKRNFDANYDRIFGKKKDYLHVIDDHEIDEIVAKAEKDPLRSLSPEEYAKLPAPSPEKLQAELDKHFKESFPRRRGRK